MELRDMLVREERRPAWRYVGPFEPACDELLEAVDDLTETKRVGCVVLSTLWTRGGVKYHLSTTADTWDDAYRSTLGLWYGQDQPFPDDARPGETVTEYAARSKSEHPRDESNVR